MDSVILNNANALPNSGTLAMTNSMLVLAAGNVTRGSGILQGTTAEFRRRRGESEREPR